MGFGGTRVFVGAEVVLTICPISALAAEVDRPVADARTDRGPERGISGLPRTITGLVA